MTFNGYDSIKISELQSMYSCRPSRICFELHTNTHKPEKKMILLSLSPHESMLQPPTNSSLILMKQREYASYSPSNMSPLTTKDLVLFSCLAINISLSINFMCQMREYDFITRGNDAKKKHKLCNTNFVRLDKCPRNIHAKKHYIFGLLLTS